MEFMAKYLEEILYAVTVIIVIMGGFAIKLLLKLFDEIVANE